MIPRCGKALRLLSKPSLPYLGTEALNVVAATEAKNLLPEGQVKTGDYAGSSGAEV